MASPSVEKGCRYAIAESTINPFGALDGLLDRRVLEGERGEVWRSDQSRRLRLKNESSEICNARDSQVSWQTVTLGIILRFFLSSKLRHGGFKEKVALDNIGALFSRGTRGAHERERRKGIRRTRKISTKESGVTPPFVENCTLYSAPGNRQRVKSESL
jgi:hypothetical protein